MLVGNIALGGGHPIRVQSMTNTPTMDTRATVAQCIRTIESGAEIMRITTPGIKDAENLLNIQKELRRAGFNTPLVADVHFNPKVAEVAARLVAKVRINPGNYTDKKRFEHLSFSESSYAFELDRIRERVLPLLSICKTYGTAIRIGVNHGSLSDRIVSRYGDTPLGMVESAMEFLRIFSNEGFHQTVISMKASNTRIMVYATRLLVEKMQLEKMHYPIHLGVTEAGEGEDGIIRSSVGIGTLLNDGIGDTIRVSLTGDPEQEIPVAKEIVHHFLNRAEHQPIHQEVEFAVDTFDYNRRKSTEINGLGENIPPKVMVSYPDSERSGLPESAFRDDICFSKHQLPDGFIQRNESNLASQKISLDSCIILSTIHPHYTGMMRCLLSHLQKEGTLNPVVFHRKYRLEELFTLLQIHAACDFGPLLIDGLADGIWIENEGDTISGRCLYLLGMNLLQASRLRMNKTEYISCPSCGRTLFDLTSTTARIRERTSHLKHLKIGIMGCIVNGPGEMADADYGYVGAGPHTITLYKNKVVVKKNIPAEKDAVDELIALIQENGDWENPSTIEEV